ncbi:MAG: hypothetical protein V3571_06860 [Pseudodesulfovibrio sp.]
MSRKMALPDELLDALSGGLMVFGTQRVTDCAVDDSGVTLTLESGDRYFRSHSAQDRTMYRSDPQFFQTLFSKSVTDDNIYAQADTRQYKQI